MVYIVDTRHPHTNVILCEFKTPRSKQNICACNKSGVTKRLKVWYQSTSVDIQMNTAEIQLTRVYMFRLNISPQCHGGISMIYESSEQTRQIFRIHTVN